MLTEKEKKEVRQVINQNKHEVYIVSLEEMDNVIINGVKGNIIKDQWKKLKSKLEFSANYYSTGSDIVLLGKLMGDLGYAGTKAYIKYYGGQPHIILKGYPGLRKIFTGTRYGLQNAKVIQMGLGKHGAVKAARGGGVLTIILLSVYRVVDFFLTDTATLNQLIGTLATDVVKVGIATGASIAAGIGISAAGAALSTGAATGVLVGFIVAIGPLVAVIAVGALVSLALSYADEKYQLTDKVIAALDEIEEKGIQGIIEEKKQALINKGNAILNNATDSVIDYAIEKAQKIFVNTVNDFFRKLTTPQL